MTNAIEAFPEFFAGDEDKFKFRRQAAQSYPFIAPLFKSRPLFRFAIDRQEPLQPAIAKAFALDKGLVRRLSGFDAELPTKIGTIEDADLRLRVCAAMGDIDPNWWPKDAKEAQSMVDCIRIVSLSMAAMTGLDAKILLSASKGKWAEFKARLIQAAGFSAEEAIEISVEDMVSNASAVGDMIRDFSQRILWPMYWKMAESGSERSRTEKTVAMLQKQAGEILFKNKTAAAILEISSKWHGQSADIAQRMMGGEVDGVERDEKGNVVMDDVTYKIVNGGDEDDEGSDAKYQKARLNDKRRVWPAILPERFVASNGYVVETIDNCDRIFEIGAPHKICIGYYWSQISAGATGGRYARSGPMVVVFNPATGTGKDSKIGVCQYMDPEDSSLALQRLEFKLSRNTHAKDEDPASVALKEFENSLEKNAGAQIKDYVARMKVHRAAVEKWLKSDLRFNAISYQVGWNTEEEGAFDRVLREWGSMRAPADPNKLVKGPWVSSLYPLSIQDLRTKTADFADILQTIAPDCDDALDARDKRIADSLKSEIASTTTKPL